MAINIPMPEQSGPSFLQGIHTGSDMFSRLMQPVLERERARQAQQQFEEQMALKKQEAALAQQNFLKELGLRQAAAARAGANTDLQRAILQEHLTQARNANDPMHEINQWKALQEAMMGGAQQPSPPVGMPQQEIGEGLGAYSPEGLQKAQEKAILSQGQAAEPAQHLSEIEMLRQNPMLRGFFKKKFGIDVAVQTPGEQEIFKVKKDLPTLQKSLKGVDELLEIAKTNPDMFGHTFMPDLYAKTTNIKDFGKWQNLISDAIAGLEQKLSSRGNIVALKMASQLKPSHAEQQPVAIGKLESMRSQLLDSINRSRAMTGEDPLPEEKAAPSNVRLKYNPLTGRLE